MTGQGHRQPRGRGFVARQGGEREGGGVDDCTGVGARRGSGVAVVSWEGGEEGARRGERRGERRGAEKG